MIDGWILLLLGKVLLCLSENCLSIIVDNLPTTSSSPSFNLSVSPPRKETITEEVLYWGWRHNKLKTIMVIKQESQAVKQSLKQNENLLKKRNKTDVQYFYTLKLIFSFNICTSLHFDWVSAMIFLKIIMLHHSIFCRFVTFLFLNDWYFLVLFLSTILLS